VAKKITIFWDIMACSPLKSQLNLLATCFHAGIKFGLFFDPEDGANIPLKRLLTSNTLKDVISQKIILFNDE
jgi:hypothetical protein